MMTPNEEEKSGETPEEEARMKDKGHQEETLAADEGPLEEKETVEEEETEDDLRLKAHFAQMDRQIAQNKSVPTHAEMVALNDAFLAHIDVKYAQRFVGP